MRTLGRYTNFTQAALARALLEDYEVFCTFFDEYSHAIGWYHLIPVRLMVADQQFQRAARILAFAATLPVPTDQSAPADDQSAVTVFNQEMFGEDQLEEDVVEPIERNNPWEILAVAYLFLVPGIGFLLERLPLMLYIGRPRHNPYLVLSPFDQHLVGLALISIAILLAISYFHTRRAITPAASALA
jgi:Putative prokaryotic signal transducing protein